MAYLAPPRGVARHRAGAMAVGLALVLLSSCASPDPTPSPTPTPPPSHPPSSTAPASLEPSPSPTPPQDEAPTSTDLIEEAVRNGTVDEATGYLYRFYAQWWDPRLPEAFRGISVEDNVAADLAEQSFAGFSPEQQALLRPFLVRPTDPASYFDSLEVARTGSTGGIQLAAAVRDPACGANDFHRVDMPSIPVTIWGRCLDVGGGSVAYTLEAEVAELQGFMTDLWGRMTTLMGTPIGDQYADPARRAPNEVEEAGDGRIDIYVVETPNTPYGRDVSNSDIAVTKSATPKENGTASGYIVYDPTKGHSAASRKSNVAHELFHVVTNRYNATGTRDCPYPVIDPCQPGEREDHWFVEASATWAEHYFVKEGRRPEVYPRYQGFLAADASLSDTVGVNAYESFAWPLFMQQESQRGADIIADTWKALERRSGWAEIQSVVDHFLPFESHFRDFAVRVWNEKLLPGDPIMPRFQALDPSFPTTRPDEPEEVNPNVPVVAPRFKDAVALTPSQNTYTFTEDLPDLWAAYYDLSVSGDTRRLVFNFGGLDPNESVDVDALVEVRHKGWERRKLGSGEIQWCLDKPADAVEQVILVLSNHSKEPNTHVKGDWTVSPDANGCATVTDTLVYTYAMTNGNQGDDVYQEAHESLTLRVSLASAPADSPYAAQYLNKGSTFRADYSSHTVIKGLAGCDSIADVAGGAGGAVPEVDMVVGNLGQEDDGDWYMAIAAAIEIPVTITERSCIGSSSTPRTQTIQLPNCDGTEIKDTDPARIFDFRCTFTGGNATWSVTGKVTLKT